MALYSSSVNDFYMSPGAVSWTLNALGNKDTLSVSVYANAKLTVYRKDVVGYNPDNNYRQWTIGGYNTYFEDTVSRYVHLAVSKVGDAATIVYPTQRLDFFGRAEETDTEDPDYWYLYIGQISDSNGGGRTWIEKPVSGNLDTDQYRNEEKAGEWAKMFQLNVITNMITQLLPFSKVIIGAAKKVISDIWRSTDVGTPALPDETVPTVAYMEKYTSEEYLSKKHNDTAEGHIIFNKGITTDDIQTSGYQPSTGLDGQGFHMYKDDNGQAHVQVDFIDVVKKAVFAELEIRKYTSIGGNLILSGANSTIQAVEPIYEGRDIVGWKCYIKTDDGTMATLNDWQEGMQALCQSFNVRDGIYEDVENQHYWRVVSEVHQRGGEDDEAYVILSNRKGYFENGSTEPKAGDTIVQCGYNTLYYINEINPTDTTLQHFHVNLTGVLMLESNALSSSKIQIATSIKSYDLVTDFSFAKATQTAKIARDGVSFNAATFKWSSAIGEIAPLIYVGAWSDWDWEESSVIPYFHEVDHGGFRWVCIASQGAPQNEPPSENSPYWRIQKAKGITFDAYLEHDSDNITVDADGNVVDGLWEESVYDSNVAKVFKLHTAVFAQKSEEYLTLDYVNYGVWSEIDFEHIDGLPYHSVVQDDEGAFWRWEKMTEATQVNAVGSDGWQRYDIENIGSGRYGIELVPNECTALVKEGMIHIVAISHIKDGVSGSGDDDWSDEQYEEMRAMQRCYVNVAVNMEGMQSKLLTFAVNINHIETSVVTAQIDNQSGTLSWSATQKSYINTCGGIITCQYRNEPVDVYSQDGSKYNPYIEIVDQGGNRINTIVGSLEMATSGEAKAIRVVISPKEGTKNAVVNGHYVARVHFAIRVNGVYYEKTVTHDIHKNDEGVTFELRPSNLTIHAGYNDEGTLVTNVSKMTCAVDIYDYEGRREAAAEDWNTYKLSMKCNGSTVAYGSSVAVSADIKEYAFVLYQNSVATTEHQTVYVVNDGKIGIGIKSMNVWYAITSSKTAEPADSAFTYDTVTKADLASGKFLWECTIVIYDDDTRKYVGKICDGSCDDFATVEEQYAVSTDNTTAPTSGWGTTYTATVGYWLWTRTRFTGKTSSVVWYSTARCIERFPADGRGEVDRVSYFALTAKESDTPDFSGKVTTSPATTDTLRYLWRRDIITYTSGNDKTVTYICGVHGTKGVDGDSEDYAYCLTTTDSAPSVSGLKAPVTANGNKGTWTDDPKGVDNTYQYEWVAVAHKRNGSWGAYEPATIWDKKAQEITSADVVYAIHTSSTSAPADSAFNKTTLAQSDLEKDKYIWSATKVTYTDGKTSIQGKVFDKACNDVATVSEQYYTSTSKTTIAGGSWSDTASPVEDRWLWTRTKYTLKDGVVWYSTEQCIARYAKDGMSGTSPVIADLDNEMDSVVTDSAGNFSGTVTLSTNVSMYHGTTEVAPTVTCANKTGVTASISGKTVTFSVTKAAADTTEMTIVAKATINGTEYTRNLTFTINKVKSGEPGSSPVVYSLAPSISSVKVAKDGTYTPTTMTCGVVKTEGSATNSVSSLPSGWTLTRSIDGATASAYTVGSSLTISSAKTNIKFELKYGAVLVDSETVAVVKDGSDGQPGSPGSPGTPGASAAYLAVDSGSFEGITPSNPKSATDGWFTVSGSPSVTVKGCVGGSNSNITSVSSVVLKYGSNASATITTSTSTFRYALSNGKITITAYSVPRGNTYTAKEDGKDKTYYIPVTTASVAVTAVVNGSTQSITLPVLVDFTAHFSDFYHNDSVFESELSAMQSIAGELVDAKSKIWQELFFENGTGKLTGAGTGLFARMGAAEASLDLKVGKDNNGNIEASAKLAADQIVLQGKRMDFQAGQITITSNNLTLDKDGNGTFSGDVKIGPPKNNSYPIELLKTGAGQIAGGNISWNAAGIINLNLAGISFTLDSGAKEGLWLKYLLEAFQFEIVNNKVVAVYTELDFYSKKNISAFGKPQGSTSGGDSSHKPIGLDYINALS